MAPTPTRTLTSMGLPGAFGEKRYVPVDAGSDGWNSGDELKDSM